MLRIQPEPGPQAGNKTQAKSRVRAFRRQPLISRLPHTNLVRSTSSVYLSAVVVNLLGLVLPLSMLQVYDRVIPNAAETTLSAIVTILILTVVIEAALRISRLYIDNFNAAKFSHNITVDALGRLLNPLSESAPRLSARKTIDRLDAIARLGGFMGGPARQIATDLPFSFVFLLAIGVVGGWLVMIPIAILVSFGALTFAYGRALERAIERKDAQDIRSFDFITEVLGGISTVKGLSTEQMMMRRFERLGRTSAAHTYDLIVASDRAQIMSSSLGNITTIAIATVGATMAVDGSVTIGTLAACSLLSGRAVQPTLRVAGIWNEYQRTKLILREASKIFSLPPLPQEQSTKKCGHSPEIRLENVSCRTGDNGSGFHNLDLTIGSNEIVSFCGPNGVGKSSILKLIAGLREPEQGRVAIDGIDAQTFRSSFVNSIGYVSPGTAIFHGSILENLTLQGAGCDHETALRTCQILGLEDEIYRFPDGYSTELGGAAVESLPKGFIQRLILARAIAQEPSVLILDEAQAFLDPHSDRVFRECLLDLKFKSTIILVTNRIEYVEMSDQIFDVSTGKVSQRMAAVVQEPARAQ